MNKCKPFCSAIALYSFILHYFTAFCKYFSKHFKKLFGIFPQGRAFLCKMPDFKRKTAAPVSQHSGLIPFICFSQTASG